MDKHNSGIRRAGADILSWLRRHLTGFLIFFILILYKLGLLHFQLNAPYIDMTLLDYVIAFGSLLITSFWVFWLPPRRRLTALVILNVLLTSLIYSDMVYYRYFGDFITIPVLQQAGQMESLGGSIASLIDEQDIFFFIDWILLIPYWIWITKLHNRRPKLYNRLPERLFKMSAVTEHDQRRGRKMMLRLGGGLLALGLGCALTFGPIKLSTSTWAKGVFVGNWWSLALYNVTGLLGFHGYDIYLYSMEHLGPQPMLGQKEMNKDLVWFKKHQKVLHVENSTYGKYKGSNVMIIQGEAFMNLFIGKQINGQEITPNFNQLMKDSLYFSNFYHQTAQGRTSDADFSVQSSLHPLQTGSIFIRYPNRTYDVLPTILKREGYSPNVFHAYDSSFWNRYAMYKAMNYDHFYNKKDFVIDEPLGWSLGDKSFLRQSVSKLETLNDKPFYAFMITLSSHHPYDIHPGGDNLDTGEFNGTMFGDYLNSVHYVDQALGEMVTQMKANGMWDNTILMFYGDHDNSIQDKTLYEKFLGKSLSDLDMQKIMNQVPLLVHLPDSGNPGIFNEPAGQLDIAPSVLHLLGIPPERYYFMGNNLFNGKQRMVVLRSGAFTDGKIYYIPSKDNTFVNGTCYNASTGSPTDINACSPGYQEALNRIAISDEVITYDLIRRWEPAAP